MHHEVQYSNVHMQQLTKVDEINMAAREKGLADRGTVEVVLVQRKQAKYIAVHHSHYIHVKADNGKQKAPYESLL